MYLLPLLAIYIKFFIEILKGDEGRELMQLIWACILKKHVTFDSS